MPDQSAVVAWGVLRNLGLFLIVGCSLVDPAKEEIQRKYPRCEAPVRCGDLYYVDCGAAIDGPSYYVARDGSVKSSCGGSCWKPRTPEQVQMCAHLCPPPEWTCSATR
jgi:hypothetical protein